MKIWTQKEEAEKLAKRFKDLKARGMGQAEFARVFGVPGGASMVTQHIKEHRPINFDSAVAYAKGFGCSLAEISPRLEQEVRDKAKTAGPLLEAPVANSSIAHTTGSQIDTGGVADSIRTLRDALHGLADEAREEAEHLLAKMARQPSGRWAERLVDLFEAEGQEQDAEGVPSSSTSSAKPLITGPTGDTTMKNQSGLTSKRKRRLEGGSLPRREAQDEPRSTGRVPKGKTRRIV